MSKISRSGVVVLFAVIAWMSLAPWLPHVSERFYVLLPVVAGPILWIAGRPGRDQLRSSGKFLVGFTMLMSTLALVGSLVFVSSMTVELYAKLAWETLLLFYFLLGLCLAGYMVSESLKEGFARLALLARSERGIERSHHVLVQYLAPLLTFAIMAPWVMAATHIHRLKRPITDVPDRLFEQVQCVTSDGLTLRGWFVPAAQPSSTTFIVYHGLGANRSPFLAFCRLADEFQANVLMFDFRGHGESDGRTVTMGWHEKHDVIAAVNYLRRERPEQAKKIIGCGISMGASALIHGAAEIEQPFDALILDSSFAAALDMTDSILKAIPSSLRVCFTTTGVPLASLHAGCWMDDVRPEDRVADVRCPVLIVHSTSDGLIPVSHAHRVHAQAREPKALLLIDNAYHGGSLVQDFSAYCAAVRELVGRVAPK